MAMHRRRRFQVQLMFLAFVIAIAGLSACGGGEDSVSTPPAESQQREAQAKLNAEVRNHNVKVRRQYRERQAAAKPTEDEKEAKESTTDFYAILGEDAGGADSTTIDAGSFCDLMSAEAQQQTIQYARVSSGIQQDWDCESAVELLIMRSKRAGGFGGVKEAKVVGVNAEGDQATATVQFGDGSTTSIPLVKEDGEWKLAASPTGKGKQ